MVTRSLPDCTWWNWHRSAQFRALSLLSAWLLVICAGVLGPLLWPLAVIRFAGSTAQTVLNIRLGKRTPLESATRADWVLVGAMVVGSYAVAIADYTGLELTTAAMLLPPLIPFSILQIRMWQRSRQASQAEGYRNLEYARMARVVSRRPFRLVVASEEPSLAQRAA